MQNSILSRSTQYILSILCVIWISNCSPSEPLPPDTVATVGNRTITISDFQRAYLPILLYTNEKDGEQTRERVLNDLLGIKILAQVAESVELDTISEIDAWVEPIRRNALLRKMYATEIAHKIGAPTEAELRQGFQRANESRLVRHLFVQDEPTAHRLYRAIQAGETDFYTAAQQVFQDSLLRNNGGELGWVRFGELDAVLEDTIYSLEPGRLSHPTHSSYGWHLVRVDDIQRNKLLTESDYQLLKPRIERMIKKRQTFQHSREFINNFMQQIDLTFNAEVAAPVIQNLADRLMSIRDNAMNEELTNLSRREIGYLQNDLTPYLEEELLRFQDEIWTVADLVERLPFMNARLMFQNSQTAIAYLVRDEVLLHEAEERGFRDDPEVQAEVRDRRDQILAQLYMQSQWDSLIITPETLKKYYRDTWAVQYSGPDSLYIVGLRFTRLDAAKNSLAQASADKTLRQLYADTRIGELQDLGWQVQHATTYPVLYNQLLQEPLLTIKGPIHTQGAWWLVQATSRHRYPLPYDQIQRQVESDYRAEKWRIFRFKLVEDNQSKFDMTVNFERLHTFTESGQ